LHPAVRRQDPGGRQQGAGRHHAGREKVQLGAHLLDAEQHHAEKPGLEKESRQYFVGHERADDRARLVGEHRPVRSELIGHDDAGDDTHAKDDGENLDPVTI
jgi:hypothetical protein